MIVRIFPIALPVTEIYAQSRNCPYNYIFATHDPIGMKISALESSHQGKFLYNKRKDEQLPVPVAFCDQKLHQKRHICNFRKYHPISFKFAIQVHNWKR